MSTINNIPFDINRTPSETNKVAPKKSAAPVYSTEALNKTPAHDPVGERRKRKDRRKQLMSVAHDRRRLKQRRQTEDDLEANAEDAAEIKKPNGPGQIINYKV